MADDWKRTARKLVVSMGVDQLTVGLEVLRNLTDETLERELSDQKLSRPDCQ